MTFHPPPPASQSITINGTLLHNSGPWGTDRPLRRTAIVSFFAREPGVGLMPGNEHLLRAGGINGDGNFSIDASAMSIPGTATMIEEFLRVEYLPTGDIQEFILENVAWGFGAPSQTFGPFRSNWMPPERALAEVNGRWCESPKEVANQLANALMDANPKPYSARKTQLLLLWEPREGQDYTRTQEFYKHLNQADLFSDFPVKLYGELEKTPMFRTKMKNIPDAMLNYLFKIAAFQQWQIERGKNLETLIKALGKGFRWLIQEDIVSDPMPDMAAACGLIYIAGRMAKDNGRMSALNYGERSVSWASPVGIKTVEMSIGR